MTKQRWRGTFGNHIGAAEEQMIMRWMPENSLQHYQRRIWDTHTALKPHRMLFKSTLLPQSYPERSPHTQHEWQLICKIEKQLKNILKIMHNVTKNTEKIHLIDQHFQNQYESLCSLYANLRDEVKKKAAGDRGDHENGSSTSGSDSESHLSSRNNAEASKASDSEDTILMKDKLTCSSEVKKETNFDESLNRIKDLEGQVLEMKEKEQNYLSRISDLVEGDKDLRQELYSLKQQKDELETKLERKSKEADECLLQIMSSEAKINELELDNGIEKEKLLEKISKLERSLSKKENEMSIEQKKSKDSQTIASVQIKSLADGVEHLKGKMESIQNEKHCLQVEVEALQKHKKLLEIELEKERENSSQLEKFSRTNFQLLERKIEDLAGEYRKQYDDQFRILSRRIKVAEQLQVENKEWYRKTREMFEQGTKEVEERTEDDLKNIKDLSLAANELLTLLDSQALKFDQCSGNLVKRIARASCELNFLKECAMTKNKALLQVKDEVCKLENKVRELEKIIKDHEDGVLAVNEEKREAIRQLCVWIDYHQGRSDFYKKMLSEITTRDRRSK